MKREPHNFLPRRRRRCGFSLLELILALSMTALLAASLYTAMNAAVRARRTANNAVEGMRTATVAAEIITQDFQNIPPPPTDPTLLRLAGQFYGSHQAGQGGGDNDIVDFTTIGSDAVSSVTPSNNAAASVNNMQGGAVNDQPLAEGIRQVELAVKTDVNPPTLVRRVTRNILSPTQVLPAEEVLATGVRGFSLRYFDGTDWLTDWDSTVQQGLPYAVQFVLDLDDPSAAGNAASSSMTTQTPTRRISRIILIPCHP